MGFKKVAVLGGGLLGGSLALALARRGETAVSLWARRDETVAEAKELGISSATGCLEEALAAADLVVLGVPVGAMRGLAERMIGAGISNAALVTDVGSVKQAVHRKIGPLLAERGIRFMGSHPMAGSERQGIAAGRADLFEGAACLLTDDDGVGGEWALGLEAFWRSLGCAVSWMDAAAHDALVARISHLPHVMAAATAAISLTEPADAAFGGGGLRDTTRVAGGDPAMWSEILMENRKALMEPLKEAHASLGEMLAMLEAGEHEAIRTWLETARRLHEAARTMRLIS